MTAEDYLLGVVLLASVVGSAALAAATVVDRRGASLAGAPRWAAFGILAALVVFAAHLVPGALGVLSAESAAATAILIAVAVRAATPARAGDSEPEPEAAPARPPRLERVERLSRVLAAAAVAVVAVYLVAVGVHHGDEALVQGDVTSFHLPNVARWIQDGSLWPVADFIPDRAPGNYPQTGDVFALAVILPFEEDFLARFAAYPFLLLAALGVYATARELAAARSTAALAATAVIAMPVVGYFGTLGLADPEMFGTFAAGGYFLLRHWRTGDRFDLVLAGIGLGLSFGTRWYAVPAVGAVILVWLVASRRARLGRAPVGRETVIVLGLIVLCGGFWLLRNLVESGNPFFPVRLAPLGIEVFDAPPDPVRDRLGSTLLGYATDPGAVRTYIWPSFLNIMSWAAVALWALLAAAVIGAVRALRGEERSPARRILALATVAALIALAYVVTPYSASGPAGMPDIAWPNSRYVVPALMIAAATGAWAISRGGRARPWAEALLALCILDGVRRATGLPGGGIGDASVLLAAALVAVAAFAYFRAPATVAFARRRPLLAGALAAVAILFAVVAGAAFERRYEERRYQLLGAPYDVFRERAAEGRQVGILGEGFGNYPLFGPRLRNEVSYIGPRIEGMLRTHDERGALARAVRRENYDLVLVQEISTLDRRLPRRQERWLRGLGYELVARGPALLGTERPVRLYVRGDSMLADELR